MMIWINILSTTYVFYTREWSEELNGRGNDINIESDLYIKKNVYEIFVPSIITIDSLCTKINKKSYK